MMKIIEGINEVQSKTIQKINESKHWLFKWINKDVKTYPNFPKE